MVMPVFGEVLAARGVASCLQLSLRSVAMAIAIACHRGGSMRPWSAVAVSSDPRIPRSMAANLHLLLQHPSMSHLLLSTKPASS